MVKATSFFISLVFIFSLITTPVWARGGRAAGSGQADANRGQKQNTGSLTGEEITHLVYIVEEEKLARDVYLTLYDFHNAQIFLNISYSEQRHMDSLINLIEKYGLENPVQKDIGSFTNDYIQNLYKQLVEDGEKSYCGALQAGIDIENLDIHDIETALGEIGATDLSRVLNNLLSGSYNHLSSFTSQSEFNNCE